jgi:peptide/nickel transport system substrate-binding protein
MDPHLTVASGLLSWGAGQAYSRVFKFETDAKSRSSVVVCDLCSSWSQPDPLTFSIQLRTDVKWHNLPPLNGRPLTAQDVVFSLKRQATANYPNAALLSNIAEFTARSEHEVFIRLNSPDSETLEKLADSHSRIVAPEAVEVNGDLRRGPTVGTGPWIVSEALADVTRLIANPDYYNDDLPYLDGLDIQVVPAPSTRAAAMRTKVLDLAQVNFDDVANARERFEEIQWRGVENPAAGVEIMMNTARSPMDKAAVREAMMLTWPAGNPLRIPGFSGILDGFGRPGVSLGLPLLQAGSLLATDKYLSLFGPGDDARDKANTLLSSAGLKPTDNVVIKVGEYGQQYIDQANEMAEGLASVGIRTEVERISTRKFGDEVWIGGDYDIAVGSPPPISGTTSYLFSVHHSDGPWNTTGYADPELDRLIEAQAQEYDAEKRSELLLEIQRRILAGSHRFIASTRTTYWMFWDYVNDFEPFSPRGDTDFLTKVWLTNLES